MKDDSFNRPDFIIIGAMKSATSSLHDQLEAHKSFFMTTPKEPNFFSDDEVYAQGIEWYQSLFAQASPEQIRGESSTHYTKLPTYPQTLSRLVSLYPKIKCIYVMRHPIDRLVSHYIHEWTQGGLSCDIDTAVSRFPGLVDYGLYAMQLEPYRLAFGTQNILPVFGERFRRHPLQELQRIFAFLGVEESPVYNSEIRSNVSAERLRVCAWRDSLVNNPLLQFLRQTCVPKSARNVVKSFWTMKKRPELAIATRREVEKAFDDDLQMLGSWLGIELNCNEFKEQVLAIDEVRWVA